MTPLAQVAELADALASGASGRKAVEVEVFSWAPASPRQRCGGAGTGVIPDGVRIQLHEGDLPEGLCFGTTVAIDTETTGLRADRDRCAWCNCSTAKPVAIWCTFPRRSGKARDCL